VRDDRAAPLHQQVAQQRRRALGRHQHQPPGVRVVAHGLQVAAQPGQQQRARLPRGQVGREEVGELVERAGGLAQDERLEQPVEVVEVAVDDRPGDAGLARDRLDRHRVEAARGDHRLGDVEELLAALARGQAARCGGSA
jgi:hypothetical protein